jgi:hypothetical protein
MQLRRSTRNQSRMSTYSRPASSHVSRSQSELSFVSAHDSPLPVTPEPPKLDGHSGKSIKGPFNDHYADGRWIIDNTPARFMHDNPPKVYLAKDIPHLLQDRMNSMSEEYRSDETARQVFLAAIQHNTAEDEPDASVIDVVNDIDDERTPPWEFHYTNKMWLGEGVPPPDLDNLEGCSCVGQCDPNSKTCACVKRQALKWDGGGFIYDSSGRAKPGGLQYPIFECNDLCGCFEDCPNRVRTSPRLTL